MNHIHTTIVAVLLAVGVTQGFTQLKDNDSVRSQDAVVSMSGRIRLNEILASNRAGRLDDEGQTSDWIEIHNPGATPMRLGGYRLTNDSNVPNKWAFPNNQIPARGYHLVWMSAQTGSRFYVYRNREGHLHELRFEGSWSHRNLSAAVER